MVTVAVDGNGADLGPSEVAAGAEIAAGHGIHVILFADANGVGDVAERARLAAAGVELIDAPVSIAKAPNPAAAVKTTPEASIVQAARAVSDGRAHALVSGGSTGSALAAGLLNIKRDRGIYRPALALPLPRPGGDPVLLLDVGANVSCRPEHLVQFAHMGSAFAQAVLGRAAPRVALLSNGEEPSKGTEDLREVFERLSGEAGAGLNFAGNIEATTMLKQEIDVVVMDGFTGNITLKAIEATSSEVLHAVRDAALSSTRGKLGGLLLAPSVRRLRAQIDPELQGGAYMLGLRQLGVVAHGRFTRTGFARAIEVAARGVEERVIIRTRAALEEAGALRRPADLARDVPS
ncbi:phosphate acyltransferase PlsX [Conexibacter sp. DBS9H8]|uniref:phosphate acyltransferase PlsX n=1 Tax=Conexibacter sp. DBS9H8 TaxID=2937801 RepID=UPI00200FBC0D|nr:phosphate acyltransferase PlsX [Conexibacter sp. DBS9H8]